MSTEADLKNIISNLERKMTQAKRFQLELAAQIVEIEKKLKGLKEQDADRGEPSKNQKKHEVNID